MNSLNAKSPTRITSELNFKVKHKPKSEWNLIFSSFFRSLKQLLYETKVNQTEKQIPQIPSSLLRIFISDFLFWS